MSEDRNGEMLPNQEFLNECALFMKEHTSVPELMAGIFMGKAPVEAVRGYAKELYWFSLPMVPSIAAMTSLTDDRESLLRIVENLARECGYYQTPNHIESYFDFTRGLGIPDDELTAHVPLAETIGCAYTVAYFCRRSIQEGLGAFALGLEGRYLLMGLKEKPRISDAFRKFYRLDERALRFWTIHEEAEEGDAEAGFEVIERYVRSAEDQQKVRRAFRYTCLTWDAMNKAWAREYLKG